MRLLFHRPLQRALTAGFFVLLPLLMLVKIYRSLGYPPDHVLQHPYFHYDLDSLEPRLSEHQHCVLPRLHPFHPSVWSHVPPPSAPLTCQSPWPSFTFVDKNGVLRFNESELHRSNHKVGRSLSCGWSPVIRVGDDEVEYGPESPLPLEGTPLPVDVVRVRCRNSIGLVAHDMVHVHVRKVKQSLNAKRTDGRPLNVLLFGVDSLSRLSFIRLLPQTFRFLTEELGMHVFRGMNKIGDNTFPNLVALLTGQEAYGGHLPSESAGFDDWPLLWKNYSEAGYATLWAEDFPKFGLFNYLAKGFKSSPTLHYMRPFWLALRQSPLAKASAPMCYGNKPRYQIQLEYAMQFMERYAASGFFGFSFLAEVSHEYVAPVPAADVHFLNFFRKLRAKGRLEDTVLIVFSDHGHRFDAIRSTEVGHIEERMPFFALHVPETLLVKFPDVEAELKQNEGRLITPFDTYATLSDLLDHVTQGTPLGRQRADKALGTSLFGTVSVNRTCVDASVPGHFCVCESEDPMQTYDPRAEMAAHALLDHVNGLLEERMEHCALLGLSQLHSAFLVHTPDDDERSFFVKVRVVIEATPSGGLFESTVRTDGQTAFVLGEVSRINPYAGQSDCIQHAVLRKYCFCLEEITDSLTIPSHASKHSTKKNGFS